MCATSPMWTTRSTPAPCAISATEIAAGKMSLNEAIREVTEKTANQFHADVKALGCLEPTIEPRATEHIDGMVAK